MNKTKIPENEFDWKIAVKYIAKLLKNIWQNDKINLKKMNKEIAQNNW